MYKWYLPASGLKTAWSGEMISRKPEAVRINLPSALVSSKLSRTLPINVAMALIENSLRKRYVLEEAIGNEYAREGPRMRTSSVIRWIARITLATCWLASYIYCCASILIYSRNAFLLSH